MIISNEIMGLNDPKEFNDPKLFDVPQLFDDPQLFGDQLEVWTLITKKYTMIHPSPTVLFLFCLIFRKEKCKITSIFVITSDKFIPFYILYLKESCYILQYSDLSTFACIAVSRIVLQ